VRQGYFDLKCTRKSGSPKWASVAHNSPCSGPKLSVSPTSLLQVATPAISTTRRTKLPIRSVCPSLFGIGTREISAPLRRSSAGLSKR
jgi:hypothetical protein